MKSNLTLLCMLLISSIAFSQISAIDQSLYTIQAVSSDNTNHPVADAFDNDPTTFWALYNENGYSLPGIVEIDLGANHDVTGFSYLPNPDNTNNRALEYALYLSNDGTTWGDPETTGEFAWIDNNDVSVKTIYFGAVTSQYVRVEYLSNTSNGENVHTAELVIFEEPGAATGQQNQTIAFEAIPKKTTDDPAFQLNAVASSGLAITYEIVSGPASVAGDILTLDGTSGIVFVKAIQAGDATYYPAEKTISFEVIDLADYFPEVKTQLSENYPLEMNSLLAYPIYASATIDEPDFLDIQGMEITVDGDTHTMESAEGYFYYMWTPSAYGVQDVTITAIGTNGNTTSEVRNVDVSNSISNQTVTSMEDVVIWFGGENSRWYYGDYSFPQSVGAYDSLIANLIIECPNGDCDDWDRWAHIDIKAPDGNWVQLLRYITPYGVACNHTIDLTDYASLLQGDVELRMFIDTWGTGGWQVTLDIDYVAGTPEYLYSSVKEVWDANYNFGDMANLQPVPGFNHSFNNNVEAAKLSISTTGHGWGQNNTQNAAEFYHAEHYIKIDENVAFEQDLWNICNPNPDGCTGQQGTWYYPRAGWCPGAIAPPHKFDLADHLSNPALFIEYQFDPDYVDLCHPNNPNCTSTSTCDCNNGYNPFYVVDGHIISYSNDPMVYDNSLNTPNNDVFENLTLAIYPNPAQDYFNVNVGDLEGKIKLTISTIDGRQYRVYYYDNNFEVNNRSIDTSSFATGTYFIRIENNLGEVGVKRLIVK